MTKSHFENNEIVIMLKVTLLEYFLIFKFFLRDIDYHVVMKVFKLVNFR